MESWAPSKVRRISEQVTKALGLALIADKKISTYSEYLEKLSDILPLESLIAFGVEREITDAINVVRASEVYTSYNNAVCGLGVINLLHINQTFRSLLSGTFKGCFLFTSDTSGSAYTATSGSVAITLSMTDAGWQLTRSSVTLQGTNSGTALRTMSDNLGLNTVDALGNGIVSTPVQNVIINVSSGSVTTSVRLFSAVATIGEKINIFPIIYTLTPTGMSITLGEVISYYNKPSIVDCLCSIFNISYLTVPYASLNLNGSKFLALTVPTIVGMIADDEESIALSLTENLGTNSSTGAALNALTSVYQLSLNSATVQNVSMSAADKLSVSFTELNKQTGLCGDGVFPTIAVNNSGGVCYVVSIVRAGADNLGSEDVYSSKPVSFLSGDTGYGWNATDVYSLDGGEPSVLTGVLSVTYGNTTTTKPYSLSVKTVVTKATYTNFDIELGNTGYNFVPYVLGLCSGGADQAGTYPCTFYVKGLGVMGYTGSDTAGALKLETTLTYNLVLTLSVEFDEILATTNTPATATVNVTTSTGTTDVTFSLLRKQVVDTVTGITSSVLYGEVVLATSTSQCLSEDSVSIAKSNGGYAPLYSWIKSGSSGDTISGSIGNFNGVKAYEDKNTYTTNLRYAVGSSEDVMWRLNTYTFLFGNTSAIFGTDVPTTSYEVMPAGFILNTQTQYSYEGPNFAVSSTYLNENFTGELASSVGTISKPATTLTTAVTYEYEGISYSSFINNVDFGTSGLQIYYNYSGKWLSSGINYTLTINTVSINGDFLLAPDGFTTAFDTSDAYKYLYNTVTILVASNAEIKAEITNINTRLTALSNAIVEIDTRLNALITSLTASESSSWFVSLINLFGEVSAAVFPAFAPIILSGVAVVDGIYQVTQGDTEDGIADILVGLFGLAAQGLKLGTEKTAEINGSSTKALSTNIKESSDLATITGKVVSSNCNALYDTDVILDNLLNEKLDIAYNSLDKTVYSSSDIVRNADNSISFDNLVLKGTCSVEGGYAELAYTSKYTDGTFTDDYGSLTVKVSDGLGESGFVVASLTDLLATEISGLSASAVDDLEEWFHVVNLNRTYSNASTISVVDSVQTSLGLVAGAIGAADKQASVAYRHVARSRGYVRKFKDIVLSYDRNVLLMVMGIDVLRNRGTDDTSSSRNYVGGLLVSALRDCNAVVYDSFVK